eukprot:GFUD01021372.1.p1 GENE.GFUD01021372.1~~GFUD01021372.1.p1  ORF type:complete len:543 (+),score=83.50 GFUD01021372.1:490-2118(+)
MKCFLLILSCLSTALLAQEEFNTLSNGMRLFTNRLLQDLESSSPSNFVFSPYSLHSTFTQLLLGSEGRTKSQLENVLGVPASDLTVSQYREITSGLRSGPSKLSVANHLAVARGFKPKQAFSRLLGNGFGADIKEYDFGTNKDNSVRQINDLVSQSTNGKIEDLLLEEDIDELTRLVLINAVYFKAVWKQSFDALETFETGFESPVSGNIATSFMNMEAKVRVLEDPVNGVEILELPYADASKSMLFILPNSSTNDIASRIAGINLADIRKLPKVDTVITIPKFNMKYQTYLKEKMRNLGADDVFSQSANLNGISSQPLFASEGVHQAFIEVNEEGTEAAAATAVVVGLRTARRKRQFFANRPFLFMVYDFSHNVPLFAGKVADPSNLVLIQRKSPLPDSSVPQGVNQNKPQQTSQTPQNVPETNLPIKVSQPEPSLKSCERLLRDFPNALDNHKICMKVKADGKFLDWLRANRNLCEQSKDLYDTFLETNCSGHWCDMARRSKENWEQEKTLQCLNVTEDKKQFCKNVDNKLKTLEHLNCA